MLIDTHAHVNFNAYKQDADEVIRRSLENDIWMINIGTKYETSKKAVELAQKPSTRAELGAGPVPHRNEVSGAGHEKGVYATIGLHPLHLETGLVKIKNDTEETEVKTKEENFDYEKYKELARSEKVVAIGEIGLDYYWKPKTTKKKEIFKQKQRDLLLKQLKLAKELDMPVIFHCRMAHQDLIQFLRENEEIRPKNAVAHGFVGNLEELKEYLNFGYSIGFNGIIFKNIEGINFEENIKNTPLDKILIETDCPYLTPPQAEGRNEPVNVKYVVEKIAKIKNTSDEEIAKITSQNAKELFNLK